MDEAVAITGMGVVTAQGVGVDRTWDGVAAGRDVLKRWSGAPAGHALATLKVAECPPLPRPSDLPDRLWRKLSRTQQLACVAVDEALAQAGLPRKVQRPRIGLFMATTVCGMDRNEQYYAQYRQDRDTADVELMRRLQPYEVCALLRRRHALGDVGLNMTCLTTCVGSAMAIGAACDAIALGECDMAIAGGSEALCRVVLSGFASLKVVAPAGCRPFDKDRPGITVGEGAGVLVLEGTDHARARGAPPLGYVRGFGVTCDAHHITAPDPEGKQAIRAMHDALDRAGIAARDVRYINAHGTGTRDNDAMESKAIASVFGAAAPWVSSTKRCTGHTFGAAGAVEAIICVEAVRRGVVPRNTGSVEPDADLPIRVARGAGQRESIHTAMSTNFAFGGNNTALIVSRENAGRDE